MNNRPEVPTTLPPGGAGGTNSTPKSQEIITGVGGLDASKQPLPESVRAALGSFAPFADFGEGGFGPHLLPIIPAGATISSKSNSLREGYVDKIPGQLRDDGWVGFVKFQDHMTEASELSTWAVWGADVGIQCREFPGIDIDINDDLRLAEEIEALAVQMLGPTPVRYRDNTTRRLMVYRCPGWRKQKVKFGEVADPSGGKPVKQMVEMLGTGNQFVARGVHKSGAELRWRNCAGAFPTAAQIQTVTIEQLQGFVDAVSERADSMGFEQQPPSLGRDGIVRVADKWPAADLENHPGIALLRRIETDQGIDILHDPAGKLRYSARGALEITCPSLLDHSDGADNGAAVWPEASGALGFNCLHENCSMHGAGSLGKFHDWMVDQGGDAAREYLKAYDGGQQYRAVIDHLVGAEGRTRPLAQATDAQAATISQWLPALEGKLVLPGSHVTNTESGELIFRHIAMTKTMFWHAGGVFECHTEGGEEKGVRPGLRLVTADMFSSRLDGFGCEVVALVADSNGKLFLKPKRCPKTTAQVLLVSREAENLLPPIRMIVASPIIVEHDGGVVVLGKGYNEEAGGIMVTRGKKPPEVPLEEATAALINLLRDFKFTSPSDESRAVAGLIAPGLRMGGIINAPAPLDLVEGDSSQAGKGFKLKIARKIYGENITLLAQKSGGVGSLDESISQAFLNGRPFVVLDNLRDVLNSTILEAAMTAGDDSIAVRVPHLGERSVDISGVTIQASSNEMSTTPDLANRCCITRICKQPEGYRWHAWPEGGLLEHVGTNQSYYLGCVFSVIKAWVDAGKPSGDAGGHDMYVWASSLDWIVQNLFNLDPLMKGHRRLQQRVSDRRAVWLRNLWLLVSREGLVGKRLRACQIAERCMGTDVKWPSATPRDQDGAARTVGLQFAQVFQNNNVYEGDEFVLRRVIEEEYKSEWKKTEETKFYIFEAPGGDAAQADECEIPFCLR